MSRPEDNDAYRKFREPSDPERHQSQRAGLRDGLRDGRMEDLWGVTQVGNSLVLGKEGAEAGMIVIEAGRVQGPSGLEIPIVLGIGEQRFFDECQRRGVGRVDGLQELFSTEQRSERGMIMIEPGRVKIALNRELVEVERCLERLDRVQRPRRDVRRDLNLESIRRGLNRVSTGPGRQDEMRFGENQVAAADLVQEPRLLKVPLPAAGRRVRGKCGATEEL